MGYFTVNEGTGWNYNGKKQGRIVRRDQRRDTESVPKLVPAVAKRVIAKIKIMDILLVSNDNRITFITTTNVWPLSAFM